MGKIELECVVTPWGAEGPPDGTIRKMMVGKAFSREDETTNVSASTGDEVATKRKSRSAKKQEISKEYDVRMVCEDKVTPKQVGRYFGGMMKEIGTLLASDRKGVFFGKKRAFCYGLRTTVTDLKLGKTIKDDDKLLTKMYKLVGASGSMSTFSEFIDKISFKVLVECSILSDAMLQEVANAIETWRFGPMRYATFEKIEVI